MITSIHIENFKSIQSLDLELGRLNIFIGANGCGKSNILEAIAMGSAAMEDKLDDGIFANRGVRIAEPILMKSRFDKNNQTLPIHIRWSNNKITYGLDINSANGHFNKWERKGGLEIGEDEYSEALKKKIENVDLFKEFKPEKIDLDFIEIKENIQRTIENFKNKGSNDTLNDVKKTLEFLSVINGYLHKQTAEQQKKGDDFKNFLIYAPENHFLRRFEEEAAAKPLGIKGEGLFKLITIIAQEYPDQFAEIKKHLKLIDWFDDFEIPGDLKFTERRIKIKDQYLGDDLQYFDQRSANEGFLYLLFYLTLFVSNETPHFFAIDNIDNSLNPKLGSELIKILAQLAKDHNKQAILTTHNPVILDGLDLDDPDQRLFVVYRNADGHTKARRIPPQKSQNGIEPVRLSEAFIRGYIGGLPDNF